LSHVHEDQSMGASESISGRTAVITGGASGIGLGVAKKCVSLGMKVAICDISRDALNKAERELRKIVVGRGGKKGDIMACKCDVRKLLDVWDFKDKVYARYGEVGFLFNNAGLGGGWSTYNTTKSEWDLVLEVNLRGVINGISAFVPSMIKQNTRCAVCCTSSVSGLVGANSLPFTGAPYVVSKTAVTALAECLSVELRSKQTKVSAHVLMPGMVRTNIFENSTKEMEARLRKTQGASSIGTHTAVEVAQMERYKRDFDEKGLSVNAMVSAMYERIRRGDFYLVITPPEQPEEYFRALAAVRGDDIVRNRPANSISMKPVPKAARKAFKAGVKAVIDAKKNKKSSELKSKL